jgi:hypothetical protein
MRVVTIGFLFVTFFTRLPSRCQVRVSLSLWLILLSICIVIGGPRVKLLLLMIDNRVSEGAVACRPSLCLVANWLIQYNRRLAEVIGSVVPLRNIVVVYVSLRHSQVIRGVSQIHGVA